MYRCKFFKLKELVHPVTFKKYGQMAWKFLDERVLRGLDLSRLLFGSLTVNDWAWGGVYKHSGYRQTDSEWGSKWSTHRRGCGFDPKSKKYTGAQMRRMLKDEDYWIKMRGYTIREVGVVKNVAERRNWEEWTEEFFTCINEIERGTTTWLHIARTNRKNFKWIPFK